MNFKMLFFGSVVFFAQACDTSTARRPVAKNDRSTMETSVKLNQKWFALERQQIQKFIEEDTAHVYQSSDKGFWYCYLKKNKTGKIPSDGDRVYFEQQIENLDGTVLYAKEDMGLQSYVVGKSRRIKGLQEGIEIMRLGEEVQFVFSSFVAYRSSGDMEQKIGPNEPIVCRIKLTNLN
jgi:gliding motility-associated peptidyl-prolyl isomerase